MRLFDVGQDVLFYRNRTRVYGTLVEYVDDDTVVIDVEHPDDEVDREVIAEMFVREADDPDDPEDDY